MILLLELNYLVYLMDNFNKSSTERLQDMLILTLLTMTCFKNYFINQCL